MKIFLILLALFALLAPGLALADPVSIGAAIGWAIWGTGAVGVATALAIGSAIVSVATSMALSYAVGAFTKSSAGGYSSAAMADRTHMIRSPIAPRNIVYGRCMVSGPLAFVATTARRQVGIPAIDTNDTTGFVIKGGENGFLHMIVILANHEIDGVEEIYLGDEQLNVSSMVNGYPTGGKFGGIVNNNEAVTATFTLSANSTSASIGGLGAYSILGLVEVGQDASAVPGGGEVATDQNGNMVLVNGGTAAVNVACTLSNANTVTGIAPVNRARNMALTYLSKGAASSYVRANIHLGSPSQTADADLIAACPDLWTSAHRLQGVAYVYLRLLYSPNIFPNGIPNVKALIRGKKIRDPRSGSYPSNSPTWTANYALCALDYIQNPDGLNCPDTDIDLNQVKVSANICDEVVTIRPSTGSQGTVTLAMYQNRYEVHGNVLLDHDPESNLRGLSTAGGGPVPLLVNGKFQIPVGYYGTPVAQALTASDLRAPVKVKPRNSRRDLFNSVGGTYVDGRFTWQPTDFPPVLNSFYQSQDAGEAIKRDITLPFTTDEIMAQRLAKIMLERSRQAITIEWPGMPGCFRLSVGDLVPVTLSKFGWTNKVFRVMVWHMNSDCSVDMVLQEDAAGIYDWNYGLATTTDLSPDTNLPDPSYIAPMGALTCYSDSSELVRAGDGTIISRLHVIWPASTDAGIVNGGQFEVQYKKASESYWTPWDKVSGSVMEVWIVPVIDTETYFVRVRAVNNRSVQTDWTYAKHTIIGNTAPPPNVANFAVTVRADGTRSFSWTTNNQPINVTNGGGYRIRYRDSALSTAWASMTPLHNGLLSQSPLQIADPVAGSYDFAIVSVNANRIESTPVFINDATLGNEPVSYGATANMLLNSDWQLSNGLTNGTAALYGWEFLPGTNGTPFDVGRHNALGYNPGRGGAYFLDNDTNAGTGKSSLLRQRINGIVPGQTYEFSVLSAPQRCVCRMYVVFCDSSLNALLTTTPQQYDAGTGLIDSRPGIGSMLQFWDKVTAPTNATVAYFYLVKFSTNAGQINSYAFWNRAMFCLAPAGASKQAPSPWIEAGMDQLHGGSLTDLSVDSKQIANEAATTIAVNASAGGFNLQKNSITAPWTPISSMGYTAPVACRVTILYEATLSNIRSTGSGSSGANYQAFLQLGFDSSYANDTDVRSKSYFSDYANPDAVSYTIRGTRQVDLTAGQGLSIYLSGAGGILGTTNVDIRVEVSRIQLEVVKK